MKKIIVALFGVVLLSGCATPYKPNGFAFNGGFDSAELEPNYFRVVFKGNEKTSRERANDFALLRVSDLMLERNCSSFAVVKSSNDIKKSTLVLPTTQTTNTTVTSYGNTTFAQTNTTPSNIGFIGSLEFPRSTIEARCSNESPNIDITTISINATNEIGNATNIATLAIIITFIPSFIFSLGFWFSVIAVFYIILYMKYFYIQR